MKKFFFLFSGIFLFAGFFVFSHALAQKLPGDYLNIPRPQVYVNDFAEIISSAEESKLEETLVTFEKNTGNEVVVVTVPSLQETTIEDFAVRLFEKWGIGKKVWKRCGRFWPFGATTRWRSILWGTPMPNMAKIWTKQNG